MIASSRDVPAHTFDRVEKLAPGEIAAVEIDLLPVGLAFHPGEQPRFVKYVGANAGTQVVHTGGPYASYLQLPVQTR